MVATRPNPLRVAACALPVMVALWMSLGNWPYTVDDSFISLRYSWNLAHGQGLTFNPGEHVEGYSNPTWVLLLAPFVALGLDGQVVAKLLGIAAHAVVAGSVAWAALRAADRVNGTRDGTPEVAVIAAAAGCFAAWTVPSVGWSAGGLETPWYSMLLVLGFVGLLAEDPRGPYVAATCAGLAGISRPEGPLQAAMLGLALVVLSTRGWRPAQLWAAGARPALLVITPVLAWAAFRWAYYQDVVPNTWYHKGGAAEWAEVVQYLSPLLRHESVFFAAGICGLALAVALDTRLGAALGLALAGHVAFVCRVGGDWMPNQRFATPGLPFVALAAGAGFALLAARAPSRGARVSVAAIALVFAGLHATQALPDRMRQGDGKGGEEITPRTEKDTPLVALGRTFSGSNSVVTVWALERLRDGQAIGYSEVGLLAYVSELRVIDLVGLTDKFMGGATGLDDGGRVEWLQSQRPEWLLLRKGGVIPIRMLRNSAWLKAEYDIVPGPKSYLGARRKDVRPITVREALGNFERAVERQPRFGTLVAARDKLAARLAAGDGEQLAAPDAAGAATNAVPSAGEREPTDVDPAEAPETDAP